MWEKWVQGYICYFEINCKGWEIFFSIIFYKSEKITHKQVFKSLLRYPCDHCEYAATKLYELNMHKQSMHDWVKYSCDQCEYAAVRFLDLKIHKQSNHEAVRYPYDLREYSAKHSSAHVWKNIKKKTFFLYFSFFSGVICL